jgi:hypothetical protein
MKVLRILIKQTMLINPNLIYELLGGSPEIFYCQETFL